MTLPASLKSRFYIDGFYTPIKIFNNAEISKIYTDYQKFVKKFGKDGSVEGDYRFRVHLLAKWAHDIVTHPTLVSAVKTVLDTQNILCWSTDICRFREHFNITEVFENFIDISFLAENLPRAAATSPGTRTPPTRGWSPVTEW